jgi:dihydrofolate reductase
MKISVFIASSIDGFIAKKDGDVAWLGEIEPFDNGGDGGFKEFFNSVDALVMGRATFEKVITFDWVYGDKPVFVLSNTLKKIPEKVKERNVKIIKGTPGEILEKVSKEGYGKIYLDGAGTIQSFLKEGLVDEISITYIPILLGSGISLFGELGFENRLELLETKSWSNGCVQNNYRVKK